MIKDHVAVKAYRLPFIYRLSPPLCQLCERCFCFIYNKKSTRGKGEKKEQPRARLCVFYPPRSRYLQEGEEGSRVLIFSYWLQEWSTSPLSFFSFTSLATHVSISYAQVAVRDATPVGFLTLAPNQVNLSQAGSNGCVAWLSRGAVAAV